MHDIINNKPIILVVDDTPLNLDIIKGILASEYRLKMASNGKLALKIAVTQQPDLILLDVMMPEMDGYEVCRCLKSEKATRDIPVIFVTALEDEASEVKGLKLGAVDYVVKPIVPEILKTRVETQLELLRIRRELHAKNETLKQERELIEQIILRMHNDEHFNGRFLQNASFSTELTSGDFIFSAFRVDGTQHVLVGDSTGHGLPAAIIGPLASYIFYSMTESGIAMVDILETINRVLTHQLPVSHFVCAAGIEIAVERDRAWVWNRGIPDILVQETDTSWRKLSSTGVPFGITRKFDAAAVEEIHFSLQGAFYLMTDGILEVTNSQGEFFGIARIERALDTHTYPNLSLEEIMATAVSYAANPDSLDDMTLLKISMKEADDSQGIPA